jgi:hypothetical protein
MVSVSKRVLVHIDLWSCGLDYMEY